MLEFDPAKRTNILETLKMLQGEDVGEKLPKDKNIKQEEVKYDEVEVKREWKVKSLSGILKSEDLKKLDLSEFEKENYDWEI